MLRKFFAPVLRPLVSVTVFAVATILALSLGSQHAHGDLPHVLSFRDASGVLQTFSADGFDTTNPFFQSLGTNGRACITCHVPSQAWTVSPADLQKRFEETAGTDPIFRTNDGSNCDTLDVSTVAARRSAYSLLLNRGVIRVSLPIPANAEFSLVEVKDPYGCATAAGLSLFRRPLPATNLRFLATVMADGRETFPGEPLSFDLASQAKDATLGHAQAAVAPTQSQLDQIVAFELGTFTAQAVEEAAGKLSKDGARGGPVELSRQPFHLGINDTFGADPTGAPFNPVIFTLYQEWLHPSSSTSDRGNPARQSIARGEEIFNSRQFRISGVKGINDALHQVSISGTCGTCHDTPNVGDHSLSVPLDIGITDYPALPPLNITGLPLYTLKNNVTGETATVTDPGRALISGKWRDIGKTKGPILRGLGARPPYFHNGSAATLDDVVEFYDRRFSIGLSEEEKRDLVAFLRAL